MTRRIAEINQYHQRVCFSGDNYHIPDLDLRLPSPAFDFVFRHKTFDLFNSLPVDLGGRYSCDQNTLLFNFADLSIVIGSQSDVYVLNEVFVKRCYAFLLPHGREVRVLDVGMNVGLASLFFAGLPFVKSVDAYEPFTPTFLQARKNFALNPVRASKINSHNVALGAQRESVDAHYNEFNSGTNSVTPADPSASGRTLQKLDIRPAAEVVEAALGAHPHDEFVIKIDTEGSEYAIFESLFRNTLSERIKGIMVEWHFNGFETLHAALLKNGFTLTSFRLDKNSGLIYAFR